MLRIGEVARITGVSPDTLRHYERRGLLRPPRSQGGYRIYSQSIVEQVQQIRYALAVGFTIAELARMYKIRGQGGTPCLQVRDLAVQKLARLDRLRARLRAVIKTWNKVLHQTPPGKQARLLESFASKRAKGEHA